MSTFGGNPVSCSAALANIEYLEEQNLPAIAMEKGEWIKGQLQALKAKYNIIGEIRGKRLMIGVEFLSNDVSKAPASEEAKKVREICLANAVLVGLGGVYGNVLRVQPPLVISQGEVEEIVKVLDKAFSKI